jgi:serine/threonine-protein kinase
MYQVTEMLHGELLTHLLERRGLPLSAEETVPIVLQICAGLQAAHDRSVVHRDIKPDNIFVVQEDPLQLKLLDFGVARLLDTDRELTAEGIMLGTPRFASPEQAMGLRRNVDPRTDVYSLGVLAYFMLCGEPPFVGDIAALLAGHAEQPPPPLAARAPQVPQPVARVVHWCLEKQAEQRPPSARALANAFAGAVAVSRPRRKTRLRCAVLAKDHGAGSEAEERKTVCARPKPAHGSKPGVADRQVACSQPDPHPAYRATVPAGRRGRPEGEPVPPRVPPPPPVQQPETGQIRGRHERKHRAWVMPVLANFVLLSIAALTALTIALIN